MKDLKTLVLMQLRDKLNLGWIKDKKGALLSALFFLVKFFVLVYVIGLILTVCSSIIHIFYLDESPQVMILVLTVCLALSLISCTAQLMKNLFFAEDNKVLITLPVSPNKIFISKIVVFYVYELKKSFSFLIPLTIACMSFLIELGLCSFWGYIWIWPVIIFIQAVPVLLGSLFAIPAMYLYRIIKKYSITQIILVVIICIAVIYGFIYLINILPPVIDLPNQWPAISEFIHKIILSVENRLVLISDMIYIIIGEKEFVGTGVKYSLNWYTLVKYLILIASCAILAVLAYFVSRPIFFNMMSKNFEINKSNSKPRKNKVHNKYITLVNKELKINIRSLDISINYILVYILVPILTLIINLLFKAMDLKNFGKLLTYAVNVLVIILPMLTSNALVATYYSREGRAGYMKKTKPLQAVYPLVAKLFFNIVLSIPSVLASALIFGTISGQTLKNSLLFAGFIFTVHLGHMLYSAMLDIINPQNEQYATTGVTNDNPNENKSTLIAFVVSALLAFISFTFFNETSFELIGRVFTKLLFIGILFLIGCASLFFARIKAYYYEIQGR